MIDQTSQFFATLTNVGAAKQANADALGVPWKIAQMGVGDANGTDPVPDASQKKLINERRRAPLNQLKVDPANNAIIIAEQVIPAEVGGFWIREIGLYDADGDLVAVANCAPSYKPTLAQGSGRTQVVRINLLVSNTSNAELRIDPSVVLATRSFVDGRLQEKLIEIDVRLAAMQPKLGFVPVQQGGGAGQLNNLVKLGWSGRALKATVDNTDLGNLWYSGNFDPATKANVGSTLFAYGITDAYTKTEVDQRVSERALRTEVYAKADVYTKTETDARDSQRPLADSITNIGLAANDPASPYMRRASDNATYFLQTKLGFVPVQQGTGAGQLNNLIKIGYTSAGVVKLAVDNTDFGNLWYSGNFDPSKKANVGSTLFAYGITDAYTKNETDARDMERPLKSEVYAKADVYTKSETDTRISTRPVADSITHVGFAADNAAVPYMRRAADGAVYYLVSDLNLGAKVAAQGLTGIGQYAFARVITAYGNSINQGTSVPGSNLLFSSTAVGDGTSSNSGAIAIGVWRAHGAFNNTERTLFQRIQ
ncbi:phage tail protein [Pseudomonas syringae]|uniref:Phage tail protein n=1 Tax=Pseudomonas syringae pv. papulans TaxID=83963 RepID=A0A0P9YJT9_PSESX|nr:phage tail protein [Pseudomonas syringae]KPY34546.1 putative Tail fiber protein H [Pseudomonas syringae pv. papulans]KWS31853.1 hypothetical protein AL059_02170 [Pseudomonas syringae pv. papulans]MDH4604999.1 phage tail protein [Pseudomonas syringae pv. papulans]MDH4624408.1 phage tail protein [Pseudomonas syringae pv. papulans]RMN49924.1 putative Tail fiber protein H [Pseudomonas syringae pv. papulans]